MTNNDDQEEAGSETAKASEDTSDNELKLPDLDAHYLELAGEKPANPEFDVQIDIDALDDFELDNIELDDSELDGSDLADVELAASELDGSDLADVELAASELDDSELAEIDPDIIDLSDEEVQQEFEKMEQEDLVASEPSRDTSAPWRIVKKSTAEAEVQTEMLNLADTKEPKQEQEVDEEDSNFEADVLNIEADTNIKAQAETYSRLSPKIIYGSLAATVVVVAVILFVGFGSDEASEAATQTIIEEEIVAVSDVVDEAPPVAEAEVAVFADEQAELVEDLEEEQEREQEIVEPVITASTGILLAAVDVQPIDVQAEVDVQTTQLETPATSSSTAADVVVEAAESTADNGVIAEATPGTADVGAADIGTADIGTALPSEIASLSANTGNFYIIVASFLTESKAREYASSVLKNQDTPTILPPLGDSRRYRVAIAGYETIAEVQANIAQFKSKYGDNIWPLRYTSTGSTTLLSAATGNIYVIVSSFLTEELARKHADTLAAEGENPSIIPPFNEGRQYRVAVFDYTTLSAAQAALVEHREEFGNEVWLMRY